MGTSVGKGSEELVPIGKGEAIVSEGPGLLVHVGLARQPLYSGH